VARGVYEPGEDWPTGSVKLIDVTQEDSAAPFAVSEAEEDAAVSGPFGSEGLEAWFVHRPILVGVATGIICFSIIAGAITLSRGDVSRAGSDDPVAGAARSDTDANRGSFSADGSAGSNFTSDEKKKRSSVGVKPSDEFAASESSSSDEVSAPVILNDDDDLDLAGPTASDESGSERNVTVRRRADTTVAPGVNTSPSASNPAPGGPADSNVILVRPGSNPAGNTTLTTVSSGRNSPTTPKATAPVQPSTTASIPTPTTATTQAPQTSPAQQSTTSTSPPAPTELMIAAPSHGSVRKYEESTTFAANAVLGANSYCWRFTQAGHAGIPNQCSSGTTFTLGSRPSGLSPGQVSVTATAYGPFGTASKTIQISLTKPEVFTRPSPGATVTYRKSLQMKLAPLEGATQYCFRLTQSGFSSGWLCSSGPTRNINRNNTLWDDLRPGPLTIRGEVRASGAILASDTTSVTVAG
jgi:hypothetical protein